MMKAKLEAFFRSYLSGGLQVRVPVDAVRMLENSTEVVLYRDAPYQVELITLRRGSVIPAHSHPNIDTYEVILSAGDSATAVVGRRKHGGPRKQARQRTMKIVPIPFGVPHSAKPGPDRDIALLSIQYWNNGIEPTFITDDWIGGDWK
jgi:hypothetical protein